MKIWILPEVPVSRDTLSAMGEILTKSLYDKYGLQVTVSEPIKDKQNVDTWKIKIQTRPESNNIPFPAVLILIFACFL